MSSSSRRRKCTKPIKTNADLQQQQQQLADEVPMEMAESETESETASASTSASHPLLNRVIALKNLQFTAMELKEQFFNELLELETSYEEKILRLGRKRQRIIEGSYISASVYKKLKDANLLDAHGRPKFPCQKLPCFWLAVLLQSPVIGKMIKPHDMPVLGYLNDIRVRYGSDKSFTLEFYFDRNDYFSNSVLRKKYYQWIFLDKHDPFAYDGAEIYKSEGCAIYWKPHKNVTVARRRQDALLDNTSSTDILPDTQRRRYVDSFFHFFNPPQIPMEKVVVDMELERILTIDFEIGNFIRRKIIPSAIPIYVKFLNSDEKSAKARK